MPQSAFGCTGGNCILVRELRISSEVAQRWVASLWRNNDSFHCPSFVATIISLGSPKGTWSPRSVCHKTHVLPYVVPNSDIKGTSKVLGNLGAKKLPDLTSYACECQYFCSSVGSDSNSRLDITYSTPINFEFASSPWEKRELDGTAAIL